MVLKLQNNLTHKSYELTVNDDESSSIYYKFNISLPSGMDDGEYTYFLYDELTEVSRGLMQIGDYTPSAETYKNNSNTYIQYNG